MPRQQNRALHWRIIREAQRRFPPGSDRRIELINRSIIGIIETHRADFNEVHA